MNQRDTESISTSRSLLPLRDDPRTWLGYACLIGVLAAVCFASLADLRLDIHDDETFRDNLAIHRDFAFFFSADKELNTGRPVAELAKYLLFLVAGNDPVWYHLSSVLVHALASLLLARLARRLGMSLELSLAGGLLFLLNVAHFQAVHWISAFDYPLALVWTLAAGLGYLRGPETGRRSWTLLFYAFLPLAVLSHLSSLMLLPFLLYWRWNRDGDLRIALRRLLPVGLFLLPLLGLAVAITQRESTIWLSLEGLQGAGEEGMGLRSLRLLLWYLSRLLTTAHWLPLPYYKLQTWELYVGAGCLAGLLTLIWKRRLPGSVWAAWTVLSLLPFLLVPEELLRNLPSSPSRYLYMASAGSSLLLSWGVVTVCQQVGRWGRLLYGAALAGLLLSGYVSLKQAETLSQYSSGRYYIANSDMEVGIEQLKIAIARGPGTIDLKDAYSRLCMVLTFMGNEELEPYLAAGLRAFPKNLTLNIYQLAMESMGADSVLAESARAQLRNLGHNPDAADLIARSYFNWGKRFSGQGAHEQAITAYERSLEFVPDRTNSLKELGLSLMRLGRSEEARVAFQRAQELDPDDYQALYGMALVLGRGGELEEAITLCERGLRTRPWLPIFRLLGECLEKTGRYSAALEVYQRALAHYPADGMLYLQQGRVLLATGDRPAAMQALEQAGRLIPEKQTVFRNLADLYFRERRFADAAAVYRMLLRLDPSNAVTHAYLGHSWRALGDQREAELEYRQVVELQPGDPVAHFNLGSLLLQNDQREQAVASFEDAVQAGSVAIETYRTLGQLYEEEDRAAEALELFRRALRRELPGAGSDFYAQLGSELVKRRALDDALQAYRRALEQDAGNVIAQVNLGWCLYLRGELDEAIQTYQTVLAQQPNSVAQFNLGLVLLARGDSQAAQDAYARGVRRFGADEAVRIGAVDDLQSLIARGLAGGMGEEILKTHWPERAN